MQIDGERISVDGLHGGRDRTFGVRVADEIDFWLWLDIGFEDRAIQAWVIESPDGTVQYVDGGITHNDGTLSKRFVKIEHDVEFDGDRKRPARAVLVFTDEDGRTYRVTAESTHQAVNVYYGLPLPNCQYEDHGGGELLHPLRVGQQRSRRAHRDRGKSMSIDQLMRFELDGLRPGHLRDPDRRPQPPPLPQLAGDGHVGVHAGQDAGRPPVRDRRSQSMTLDRLSCG